MTTPSDKSYREIPLTQGQVALVDAADYEWLNRWNWYAMWSENTRSFYAVRNQPIAGDNLRRRRLVKMHRLILGLEFGDPREGDHIKCEETLNNQKSNLRIATSGEQKRNQRPRPNRSGFKGVRWNNKNRNWFWSISVNGKERRKSGFASSEDAYKDRNQVLPTLHGEFARFK